MVLGSHGRRCHDEQRRNHEHSHGRSVDSRHATSSGADVPARLYIDEGESIRVRVEDTTWQDIKPVPPPQYDSTGLVVLSEPEKDPIDNAGFKVLVS